MKRYFHRKMFIMPLTATFLASSLSVSFAGNANAASEETVHEVQQGETTSDELTAEEKEEVFEEMTYEDIQQLEEHAVTNESEGDFTTQSKGSIAIKQASKYLKDNVNKVDGWIDSGIDKLPVGSERKKTWKAAISVVGVANVMDHYVGIVSSVEEAMTNAIVDTTPIPKWAASGISKTVTFFLPI